MSKINKNAIIKEIDEKIIFYTNSFSELIAFLKTHEQLDQFYKTINKNFSLNDISTLRNHLNFDGYLTTMILDLLIISKGLIISTQPWEKILHYRLGYTLIHEGIPTYHKHIEMGKLSKANSVSNDLQKEISIALKIFKKNFNFPKAFVGTRTKTLAHIESDLKLYYNEINKIDEIKYCHAIVEFLQILYKMQTLSNILSDILIMKKNGEPFTKDELIKELSEKIDKRLKTTE